MADKMLCPWCGSEMRYVCYTRGILYQGYMKCKECDATGPMILERDEKDIRHQVETAALRRYEPPVRPLTLEEFEAVYDAREDHEWPHEAIPPYLFLDSHIEKDDNCWLLWCVARAVWENDSRKYTRDTYGKTWRCWLRKPTEQEREACGWDDV